MTASHTTAYREHLLPADDSPPKPRWTKALIAGIGVTAALAVGTVSFVITHPYEQGAPSEHHRPTKEHPVIAASPNTRLRIINGCAKDPLWIANFAFNKSYIPQDLKLEAGAAHEFAIPEEGLAATRFWAKWGCDAKGNACEIGQSGGPGESCGPDGCDPPIDSKFEATFGCMPGSKTPCAVNPSDLTQQIGPTDWWDVSQVDGWTLPYKVDIVGECPMAPKQIDCSRLSLHSCPTNEDLGLGGKGESLQLLGSDGTVAGCYAPCAKLTYSQLGQGHTFTPESPEAQNYCCPTPPITPAQCSAGPVIQTQYVKAVHELCPGVYAYAYDDGMGLAQCPAGTRYDVTFYCP